jgi:hypothetical protein
MERILDQRSSMTSAVSFQYAVFFWRENSHNTTSENQEFQNYHWENQSCQNIIII